MRELGWDVLGIERSARAAEHARATFGVSVVEGTIPCPELPRGEFDLITAWQVLEHVDRPRQTLAGMRELLRPQGRLMLTVPNQSSWAASIFGPAWAGLDLPRHLSHFTPQTLRRMVEAEGFRVSHLTTLRHAGWIRHSARHATRANGRIRHWTLRTKPVSRLVSAWACLRGNGESIYLVARPA